MGIDPFILQKPNIARLLDPETRSAEKIKTPEESREKAIANDEREIQKMIYSWLNLEGLYFDWDAMHKKRTGTTGAPDFQLPYKGRAVFWEVKPPWAQKLRPEQVEVMGKIIKQGGRWRLITCLQDAQAHLRELDHEH